MTHFTELKCPCEGGSGLPCLLFQPYCLTQYLTQTLGLIHIYWRNKFILLLIYHLGKNRWVASKFKSSKKFASLTKGSSEHNGKIKHWMQSKNKPILSPSINLYFFCLSPNDGNSPPPPQFTITNEKKELKCWLCKILKSWGSYSALVL